MAEKIRKHKKLLAYMVALAVFTTYVVMDTFVITRVYGEAADSGSGTEAALQADNDDNEGQTEESTADGSEGSAAVWADCFFGVVFKVQYHTGIADRTIFHSCHTLSPLLIVLCCVRIGSADHTDVI